MQGLARGWDHPASVMLAFAETHRLAVHVLQGETKISSLKPEDAVASFWLYVHGDRALFVDDPHAKSTIANMKAVKPQLRPDAVLKVIAENGDPPSSEWGERHGVLCPDHFYADDLAQAGYTCTPTLPAAKFS
jgi:hypothetical protein